MSLLKTTRPLWCLSCLSRTFELPSLFSPVQIQVRGKKKLPRSTTITIRLLKDVRAYGRKGTILAIAPARMRNHLYPRAQAAYMTVAEIRQAQADELVMERDATFGTIVEAVKAPEKKIIAKLDMRMVTPQRAHDILDTALAETLVFERRPIVAEAETTDTTTTFIYGSVSSLDILTELVRQLGEKAKETEFEDAVRVVLSANDIQINTEGLESTTAESDRIKALGDFKITIDIKGAEPITRTIRVNAAAAET